MFILLILLLSLSQAKLYIVTLKSNHKDHLNGFVNILKQKRGFNIKGSWNMDFLSAFYGEFNKTALNWLSKNPIVDNVQENQEIKLDSYTNFTNTSPYYNWALSRLSFNPLQPPPLDRKYAIPGSGQGEGTHIYILDTGIRFDYNLSEFSGRIGNGQTCIQSNPCNNNPATDDTGHGTAVASLAAGATVGVAQKATIHPVKVFLNGVATTIDIVNGINWVISQVQANRI